MAAVSSRHASGKYYSIKAIDSLPWASLPSDEVVKRLLGFWLAVLTLPVSAFDPDRTGPPPKSRTVEETKRFATSFVRPVIDFQQEPLESSLGFLLPSDVPPEYRVKLDASGLTNWRDQKITLRMRNTSVLQALQAMAKQLDADVKIGENVISLVPRKAQK